MALRRPPHDPCDERGAVAILVSVFALVMFVLAALVVDLGMARETRRDSQNAADASALAAANRLYLTGAVDPAAAVDVATSYSAANFQTTSSDWSSCTDASRPAGFQTVTGKTPCVSFSPNLTAPTEVRVVMPVRTVKTGLGNAAGVSKVAVGALAQAAVMPGGAARCGLCVIGSGSHDIQNGDVTVSGADIYVNGDLDAKQNGSMTALGGQIRLEGSRPSKGTFTPSPLTDQPAIADPLAGLVLPPDMSGLSAKTGSACGTGPSAGPGIYKTLQASSACTLQPGLYVITQPNHYSGQTVITAQGVTLYFTCQDSSTSTPKARTCSPGESGGDILMTGQAVLNITAPTSGATAGLALVSDRNNTAEMGFRGNGALPISGTIYLKSGALDFRGNGAGAALDSLIVVDDLDFSGNPSGFVTTYTQTKNVQIPAGSVNLTQ